MSQPPLALATLRERIEPVSLTAEEHGRRLDEVYAAAVAGGATSMRSGV